MHCCVIQFGDIYLNVAAQALHIIRNVYDVMQQHQQLQQQQLGGGASGTTDDAPPTNKHYYDLWQTRTLSRDEWLQPEAGTVRRHYVTNCYSRKQVQYVVIIQLLNKNCDSASSKRVSSG